VSVEADLSIGAALSDQVLNKAETAAKFGKEQVQLWR